ncbi:MAG: site-2 protease family protein [Candidatus Kapabacteria bacterium]|nr:site-2 protease family protein [Candidatus Kapabacteria bacterium]
MGYRRVLLHAGLFVATFVTCMMAGAQWMMKDPFVIENWSFGLTYALLVMSFLATHEFGHYFAARWHGIDATLPYFIPVPSTVMPFGTFGAVIRTKSPLQTRNALFDVGVSGPLAGFVVCMVILIVGIVTLPGPEYLYGIHPTYATLKEIPASGMTFGDTLLFSSLRWAFSGIVTLPPMNEIYHYPFLCVGWFGLFVTALNMLPFGQLDGGHVLYALLGKKQHAVARVLWWILFAFAIFSMLNIVYVLLAEPYAEPWIMWLQTNIYPQLGRMIETTPWLFHMGELWIFWMFLVRFVIKIDHAEIPDPAPLSPGRQVVGWLSIVMLIVSFSPRAIFIVP